VAEEVLEVEEAPGDDLVDGERDRAEEVAEGDEAEAKETTVVAVKTGGADELNCFEGGRLNYNSRESRVKQNILGKREKLPGAVQNDVHDVQGQPVRVGLRLREHRREARVPGVERPDDPAYFRWGNLQP
jgi:hypothetical protein